MVQQAQQQNSTTVKTGGQILVDALLAEGATQAFCVPGESYLAVLDALRDAPLKLVTCRQESGACMMAEAQGKLTGKPGLCFVTRGPGATNASAGIHIAMQDSTPLILFIGQVERAFKGREAFQEIDYEKFFAPICKWVVEIQKAADIPEVVARAFSIATSGRPGPVVISLPEDVLTDLALPLKLERITEPLNKIKSSDLEQVAQKLRAAQMPFILIGGSTWTQEGYDTIHAFATRTKIPVAVSFRRQGLFSHTHECFVGHLGIGADAKLIERIKSSDCLVMIGGRLSEMPSQSYTLLDIPKPRQPLIHIHPDPQELNKVYQADLAICARADDFVKALSKLELGVSPCAENTSALHQHYLQLSTPIQPNIGAVQMGEVMKIFAKKINEDAIICNGAGNYAAWVHRFHRFQKFKTQLAPTSGSMGYGLPAALGAKSLYPNRQVICFAGDGCLMMTVQELATAVQGQLAIIVIVIDNGMYGTIRMHQEKHYPTREVATALQNPDFVKMAESFGAKGFSVFKTEEFEPALRQALQNKQPTLIHIKIDPEVILPTTTLTAIRNASLQS